MPALVFLRAEFVIWKQGMRLCGNRAAAKLLQEFRMLFAPISDRGNRMVSGNP